MSSCALHWCNALTSGNSRWCAQHQDENEQQIFHSQDAPLEQAWQILKFIPFGPGQYRGLAEGVVAQHAARRGPTGALPVGTIMGQGQEQQEGEQEEGQPPQVMPGHPPNCGCQQCLQLQTQSGTQVQSSGLIERLPRSTFDWRTPGGNIQYNPSNQGNQA